MGGQAEITCHTNGIDPEFVEQDFTSKTKNDLAVVIYAGNIGEGQGLDYVLPEIAARFSGSVHFSIVGDGGRCAKLRSSLLDARVMNVQVIDPVARSELYEYYRRADILFLHLNDLQAFRKVLPSKIFEYAATRKPILAGVAGYARTFLEKNVAGVELFTPGNTSEMETALRRLLNGPRLINRDAFCARYMRKKITRQMALDILSLKSHAQ
jgi:glycosyltransferase involved in cell wall biosynthesis